MWVSTADTGASPSRRALISARSRSGGGVFSWPVWTPGPYEQADQLVLARLVGALGDVVLDLVAGLVDRVGALAEAQVALAGPGVEADADRVRPGRPADRGLEAQDSLAVGP